MEKLVHHRRIDVILGVIFLLPSLPKDMFCYLAGLSDLKAWRFVLVTTLARVPGLVLSSWLGQLAVHGLGRVFFAVLAVSCVLGALVFVYRRTLLAMLVKD